ncbi:MAG: molybdopterin synthase [Halobacteriota archaeon]|nr:molybdopterin synthase [Halobacteriota archaeon]
MKIVSIIGEKNSGKTSLIVRLIPMMKRYGSVGVLKHIHSQFDSKGRDTEKFSNAGAEFVMALTPVEAVKISKRVDLEEALVELADEGIEIALVEGFKSSKLPKIAIGDVTAENVVKRVDPDVDPSELVEVILEQDDFYTLDSLILKAKASPDIRKAGAIGTFTGIVRGVSEDVEVKALEFEMYAGVAEEKINHITEDLKKREGVLEVFIHHRSGYIETGNDIVYIVVLGAHRSQVFNALSDAIERVKEEVPIWKKELTVDGDYWIHDKA